jgi:hypothetical protein
LPVDLPSDPLSRASWIRSSSTSMPDPESPG